MEFILLVLSSLGNDPNSGVSTGKHGGGVVRNGKGCREYKGIFVWCS